MEKQDFLIQECTPTEIPKLHWCSADNTQIKKCPLDTTEMQLTHSDLDQWNKKYVTGQ